MRSRSAITGAARAGAPDASSRRSTTGARRRRRSSRCSRCTRRSIRCASCARPARRRDASIETSLAQLDHADAFDHLVVALRAAARPARRHALVRGAAGGVARLRSPDGGCPWDLEQTHETLKRFLLEEAYEALDALDDGEPHRLAEELGDLLMQVVLHAQVAEDSGDFVIEDVIASITEKLIRRHPHVFGDVRSSGASEVLRNWDTLKKQERGGQPLLDAVPKAMPALAQAQSLQAARRRPASPAPAGAIRDRAAARCARDRLGRRRTVDARRSPVRDRGARARPRSRRRGEPPSHAPPLPRGSRRARGTARPPNAESA